MVILWDDDIGDYDSDNPIEIPVGNQITLRNTEEVTYSDFIVLFKHFPCKANFVGGFAGDVYESPVELQIGDEEYPETWCTVFTPDGSGGAAFL